METDERKVDQGSYIRFLLHMLRGIMHFSGSNCIMKRCVV